MAATVVDDDGEHVAEAMERIGEVIAGKWHLDTLLGVGGMAAVYAATHRNGNRVALKMLHPVMRHSRSLRERFLREGYTANRVDHEGVVRVLDDDELEDGTAFLVMELLSGETLEARWQRFAQRLPLADVLGVADALLRVLAAAHEKGISHRDIKPDNVFVTRAGELKVLDFGIARFGESVPGGPTSTRTGIALGTPAFMPPEQALGKSREIDGRCDLWAVGATMFTLLSGRFVHLTDSPSEMLVKAATERAPSFASVMPHIPAPVGAIIDRALSFEKEARFPDASSMRAAVQRARSELGYLRSTVIAGDLTDEGDAFAASHRPTVLEAARPRVTATGARTLSAETTPPPSAVSIPARSSRPAAAMALALLLLGTLAVFAIPPALRAHFQRRAATHTTASATDAPSPAAQSAPPPTPAPADPAPKVEEPPATPTPQASSVAAPSASAPPQAPAARPKGPVMTRARWAALRNKSAAPPSAGTARR